MIYQHDDGGSTSDDDDSSDSFLSGGSTSDSDSPSYSSSWSSTYEDDDEETTSVSDSTDATRTEDALEDTASDEHEQDLQNDWVSVEGYGSDSEDPHADTDTTQEDVNESFAESGFVNVEDDHAGGHLDRSPEAGDEITQVGDTSESITVEEDVDGRFVGDAWSQLEEYGAAATDTSEPGDRTTAEMDAVATGNEVAGATFETVAGADVFDPEEFAETFDRALPEPAQDAAESAGFDTSSNAFRLGTIAALLAVVGGVYLA
jgi:hypothetical protein